MAECVVISINPSRKKESLSTSYVLHDQVLETTDASKYLGVTISNDLSWSKHVDAVAAKASRTVGFLRRNLSSCPTNIKAAAYTATARPVLEYASSAWDPYLKKDVQKLEQTQRRTARFVTNNFTDKTPGVMTSTLQALKWDSLEERRERARLVMLYKMQNKLVDVQLSQYCKPSDPRTRGVNRLHTERADHPALHNSFFPRTLRAWNKLPTSTSSAPSLEVFRTRIGCCNSELQSIPSRA